ncbi:hypothetical protein [Limosilactobacillus caecicola]|nr:hypothetical protein [Limosilactobacillus caecicola]
MAGSGDAKLEGGNFTPINMTKENGKVYGEYLPFVQDITYAYV